MSRSKSKEKIGLKTIFPYFIMLAPLWLPLPGGLLCGVVYGVSSGFGLPYMVDQIFPKIFPNDDLVKKELSSYQLALYVAWLPAVFLIRGLSGYFNSYLINFCGILLLEKFRLQVFG